MNAPQTFVTAPGPCLTAAAFPAGVFPADAPTTIATPEDPRDARGHVWRHDGWTPDRQRTFLARIAEGHTVDAACRTVGLAPSSAYALRRRAGGAAFALGWQAAALLARDLIADALVTRAIDGQTDTVTRPDGSIVTRHRYDNRLATAMLSRLDRLADASVHEGTHTAARMIAGDWEAYLDLVEQDAGPARAGLFLGARAGDEATHADLAPIVTLARADRYLRTGAATASDVDTADLDPAIRAHWTAEQWARAEAAGLLILAPEPEPEAPFAGDPACDAALAEESDGTSPLSPLDGADAPVWYDDDREEWRTHFPPPALFNGDEDGEPGDDGYERALTRIEAAIVGRVHAAAAERTCASDARDRDAWFAALAETAFADTRSEDADSEDDDDADAPEDAPVTERAVALSVDAP